MSPIKRDLVKVQTPEDEELSRKLTELAALETEVAQRELDLVTLQAELNEFEREYLRVVGVKLAELDEIEARIAEAEARLKPKDDKAQERAQQARAQAQESAQTAGVVQEARPEGKFKPSDELKEFYRELAKRIHPDLATSEEERALRTKFMTEANLAYERGDLARLREILKEWESSPDTVRGEGVGADLVRTIRKIAQMRRRMGAIQEEMEALKRSELYLLWEKALAAQKVGRDFLKEMAERVEGQVKEAKRQLVSLSDMRV